MLQDGTWKDDNADPILHKPNLNPRRSWSPLSRLLTSLFFFFFHNLATLGQDIVNLDQNYNLQIWLHTKQVDMARQHDLGGMILNNDTGMSGTSLLINHIAILIRFKTRLNFKKMNKTRPPPQNQIS